MSLHSASRSARESIRTNVPIPSRLRFGRAAIAAALAVLATLSAACAPPPEPTPALSGRLDLSHTVFVGTSTIIRPLPFVFTAEQSGSGTVAIKLPTGVYPDSPAFQRGFAGPQTTNPTGDGYTSAVAGTCSTATVGALSAASFQAGTRIEVSYTCAKGQQFQVNYNTTMRFWDLAGTGAWETWTFTAEVNTGSTFTSIGSIGQVTLTPVVLNVDPAPLLTAPPIPIKDISIPNVSNPSRAIMIAEGVIDQSIPVVTATLNLDFPRDADGNTVIPTSSAASIRQDIQVVGCGTFKECVSPSSFGQVRVNNPTGSFVYPNGVTVATPYLIWEVVGRGMSFFLQV